LSKFFLFRLVVAWKICFVEIIYLGVVVFSSKFGKLFYFECHERSMCLRILLLNEPNCSLLIIAHILLSWHCQWHFSTFCTSVLQYFSTSMTSMIRFDFLKIVWIQRFFNSGIALVDIPPIIRVLFCSRCYSAVAIYNYFFYIFRTLL